MKLAQTSALSDHLGHREHRAWGDQQLQEGLEKSVMHLPNIKDGEMPSEGNRDVQPKAKHTSPTCMERVPVLQQECLFLILLAILNTQGVALWETALTQRRGKELLTYSAMTRRTLLAYSAGFLFSSSEGLYTGRN